jgi:hypothetical protein
MIEFKVGSKTVDIDGWKAAMEAAALQIIKDQLRERVGAIRNPVTGEFPTVIVDGTTPDSLQIFVEASEATLAIVRQSLSADELGQMTLRPRRTPKAFLSYARENRATAQRIAQSLQAKGIDTWWDEWAIPAGESLRQKIDQGLGHCTHFIVLLTKESISKAWVNQEMDAAVVRKLQAQCTFIPLRCGFPASDLPPLLSGMMSPEIDEAASDLTQLISDIHGISRKPPLGDTPAVASIVAPGYSNAASAAAKYFVENSPNGLFGDIQSSIRDLMEHAGLSENDAKDAIHELGSLVHSIHVDVGTPTDELYVRFDSNWKGWDPKEDALKLAADLWNDSSFPRAPREIASRYDWPPRRLNPAMAYLVNRHIVKAVKGLGGGPFSVQFLHPTDDTRRFVSGRSL